MICYYVGSDLTFANLITEWLIMIGDLDEVLINFSVVSKRKLLNPFFFAVNVRDLPWRIWDAIWRAKKAKSP